MYILTYLSKFVKRGDNEGEENVYSNIDTHTFLPQNSWQEVVSFQRSWGQLLVYSLTEMIMMLLTALRQCTLYDNRLEKTSQKVTIMRICGRTYFRLRAWEGIIHLMEQAELHIRVDVILLLLRVPLKQIPYTPEETFLLQFKSLQNILHATAGLQNDKSTSKKEI